MRAGFSDIALVSSTDGRGLDRLNQTNHIGSIMNTRSSAILWPPDLAPAVAAFHVRNELETSLAPERIWPWLLHARRWPELYADATRVKTPAPELALGMRFTWWTLGVPVTTVVEDFVPNERLAW